MSITILPTKTTVLFPLGDGFFFKEEASLCPPKPKKARTRADIAKAGIALYKKKQGKK